MMTFGVIMSFTRIDFAEVSHMLGMWHVTFCNEHHCACLQVHIYYIITHMHSVFKFIMPVYLQIIMLISPDFVFID